VNSNGFQNAWCNNKKILIYSLYILNDVCSMFAYTEVVVGFLEHHAVSSNSRPNYNPSAERSFFVTVGTIVIFIGRHPRDILHEFMISAYLIRWRTREFVLLKHQYGHLLSGPEMAYGQQTLEKHSTLFGVKFLQNVKKEYGGCARISFSFLFDRENLRVIQICYRGRTQKYFSLKRSITNVVRRQKFGDLPDVSILYFFFHCHYSPLWALACRTRSFHFSPSVTNSLHHR
jgi:hypothetical protein